METYKKTIRNGGYILINPNMRREKIIACEFGGDTVRLSRAGKTWATRGILEDSDGRYFIHNKIRYNLEEA